MKLNVPVQACDPDRLESFLRGEFNDAQEREFAEHLNSCHDCRRALEHRAAGPEAWREAEELLKPSAFDRESDADPADFTKAHPSARQPLSIQYVLDTLAPTDDPQMLGRLGGYEVSGVVGVGGMGVVLKAVDRSLDRTVAVKVMAPHLASSGAARKRFAREAKAAAAVLHPNVIAIHSVSNDEALPYLVMPYLRGASLQKRLDDEGPLALAEILRIGSQIAAGLAAAHAQGLVHRDIKPANILLEEGIERVAITDFGLARAIDDATITHSGAIAGTPQYMSPEQARGESVDPRSDLFSLGSVMYAMCTGRPPFRAETNYGVMRRITDDEPTPIRRINPEVPEWLCTIIARLMSKRAADRLGSAAEVAQLLETCLAHVQQPAVVPLPASLVLRSSGRRWIATARGKGVIAVLAISALILLTMCAWLASRPSDNVARRSGSDASLASQSVESQHKALGVIAEPEWGEPDGGVRIRASVHKRQWRTDESVILTVDLKNESGAQLAMARRPYGEVEIDGVWYVPAPSERLVAGAQAVGQGVHERVAVISLDADRWVLNSAVKGDVHVDAQAYLKELLLASADPKNQLQLTPGMHTIRVACEVNGLVGDSAKRVGTPVSKSVEIEVIAAEQESSTTPRSALDDDPETTRAITSASDEAIAEVDPVWGAAENGLQVGVSLRNAAQPYGPGERVFYSLHIRSAGDEPVRFEYYISKTGGHLLVPTLWDAAGAPVRVTSMRYRGGHDRFVKTLKPGESAPIKSGSLGIGDIPEGSDIHRWSPYLAPPRPGRYQLGIMFPFTEVDADDKPIGKSFTLTTGRVDLTVVDAAPVGDDAARDGGDADDGGDAEDGGDAAADEGAAIDDATPKPARSFSLSEGVATLAYSPDATRIAVANGNPSFVLLATGRSRVQDDWKPSAAILDAETGMAIVKLKLTTKEEDALLAETGRAAPFEVTALAFSPDGSLLAVATNVGQVKLFNTMSGELVQSLDDDREKRADANTPEKLQALRRAMGGVTGLAFSPDGKLLATCGRSFADEPLIHDGVTRLGERGSTGPGRLKLWDLTTGALKHDLVGHSDANAVAFSADGTLLVSAGRWTSDRDHGTGVIVWNPETGANLRQIVTEANGGTHEVAFAPNKKLVVFGSRNFDKENDTVSTTITVAYPLSGIVEWKRTVPGWVKPHAFSPDGKTIAAIGVGAPIRFFDAETGAATLELNPDGSPQRGQWSDFALAPRGRSIATGGMDETRKGHIEIWDLDILDAGEPGSENRAQD